MLPGGAVTTYMCQLHPAQPQGLSATWWPRERHFLELCRAQHVRLFSRPLLQVWGNWKPIFAGLPQSTDAVPPTAGWSVHGVCRVWAKWELYSYFENLGDIRIPVRSRAAGSQAVLMAENTNSLPKLTAHRPSVTASFKGPEGRNNNLLRVQLISLPPGLPPPT